MAARLGLQHAGEYRLMKSELLLDRFRGEAYLPADLALAGRGPAVDQRKLDSIRLIQRQPIEIGQRKKLAAGSRHPEILNRSCKIDAHRQSPEGLQCSLFRTLPIAEFANDVAAGDRMEGEGIHIMIGEDEGAKTGIVMARHMSVLFRIGRVIPLARRKRSMKQ